jgi:hypothetical protein
VQTSVGETIKLIGSSAELGAWDTSKAVALSASQYTSAKPLWFASVQLPVGTQVQYKFIRVSSSGRVTWESDPNRAYTVPSECGKTYAVDSTWK